LARVSVVLQFCEVLLDLAFQFRKYRAFAKVSAEPGAVFEGVGDEGVRGRFCIGQSGVDAGCEF
jgi:hypothetical protein